MKSIPDYILDAQQKLAGRRKLSLILNSNATFEENISIGEMIEFNNKSGFNKRGVWSTPKIVSESVQQYQLKTECLHYQILHLLKRYK